MGDRGHNRHGPTRGGCCAPSAEHWALYMLFWWLLPRNFARCKIHFASTSCLLLYKNSSGDEIANVNSV